MFVNIYFCGRKRLVFKECIDMEFVNSLGNFFFFLEFIVCVIIIGLEDLMIIDIFDNNVLMCCVLYYY